jgi:hypothetical protein
VKPTTFAVFATLAATSQAFAGGWAPYGNARYNYWIDMPPGFSKIEESANGDGGTSRSPDGRAELAVWGSYPGENDFSRDVKWRVDQERSDGWSVDYQRLKSRWAVWSGSKGGRLYYERAIPVCGGAVAYFRLEYDKAQAGSFDPIVARLGKSLRSGDC